MYSIWVEDASGCAQGMARITIDPVIPPTDMEFSNTGLLCPSNTTTLTVDSVTGGVAPLEYQIISPSGSATAYQSSNEFTGLGPGTYTIQVRDANECTYSETYTIAPLPELSVTAQLMKLLDCSANPDAEISGVISDGTAPYTYGVSIKRRSVYRFG